MYQSTLHFAGFEAATVHVYSARPLPAGDPSVRVATSDVAATPCCHVADGLEGSQGREPPAGAADSPHHHYKRPQGALQTLSHSAVTQMYIHFWLQKSMS